MFGYCETMLKACNDCSYFKTINKSNDLIETLTGSHFFYSFECDV